MSDPLTPEQQIIEVLKDVSRDDAYQLLAGLMHTLLDLMADRQVDMLLIFFVTHAWESRAARAEGRTPNFATRYQLNSVCRSQRQSDGEPHQGECYAAHHSAPA